MSALRTLLFTVLLAAGAAAAKGQLLRGAILQPEAAGRPVYLFQACGDQFQALDTTLVAPNGRFQFDQPFHAAGFYQLAINDSDQVNLVLDPREPLVDLVFPSLPLAAEMEVLSSRQNKELRAMQYMLAQTNAIREAARQNKLGLNPMDTLYLHALDRVVARADSGQQRFLDQLAADAANSFLARTVAVERAVDDARRKGPMAVAYAFDFSSPELLRSKVYDKAVVTFLQNLNAVSEDQFLNASDTLMELASGNAQCRAYMLEHLIDLFATYGPDRAMQHLVDRYVVAAPDTLRMAPELRALVEDLMRVSVGRIAPDIVLNDHGTPLQLGDLVSKGRYTALFFYSSTCEHCHAQMPGLKDLREAYHGKGFDVIGIAFDVDSAQFLASIRDNTIPWKCFSEFNGWGSSAAKAFQVKGTPMIFLVDREMKIVAKPATPVDLAELLRKLLG